MTIMRTWVKKERFQEYPDSTVVVTTKRIVRFFLFEAYLLEVD